MTVDCCQTTLQTEYFAGVCHPTLGCCLLLVCHLVVLILYCTVLYCTVFCTVLYLVVLIHEGHGEETHPGQDDKGHHVEPETDDIGMLI